jgi:hypothetical protein
VTLFHKLQQVLMDGKGLRAACEMLLSEIKLFARDVLFAGVQAVAHRVPNSDCPARLEYELHADADNPHAKIFYWGSSASAQRSNVTTIAQKRAEVVVTCAAGALAVTHSPPLVDEDDIPVSFQIMSSDRQGTGHIDILNLMKQVLAANCRSMLRQLLTALETVPGCNLTRSDEYHVHAFWSAGVEGGLSLLVRVDPASGMFCAHSPTFSDASALSELNAGLNASATLDRIVASVARWVAVFVSSCIRAVAASMGVVAVSQPYTTPLWRSSASKITNDDRFMAVCIQLKNSTLPSQPLLWFDLPSCSYMSRMFPHTNSQSTVAVDIESFASASSIKSLILRFLVHKNEQFALENVRDEASKCGIKWALSGCDIVFNLALGNGRGTKWILQMSKQDAAHACSYAFLSTDVLDVYCSPFIVSTQPMCKADSQCWLEDAVSTEGNSIRIELKSLTSEICGQPVSDLSSSLLALDATVKAFPKMAQIFSELSSVCGSVVHDSTSASCFSPRQLTPRSESASCILSNLRFKGSVDSFGPAHVTLLLFDLTSPFVNACFGLSIGWRHGRVSMCRMHQASLDQNFARVDVVSPMLPLMECLLQPQLLIFDAVALTCIWFRVEHCINRFLSDLRSHAGDLSKSSFLASPVSLTSVRVCFMQLFWFNIEALGPSAQDLSGSAVQQYRITDAGSSYVRKRPRDDCSDAAAALPWNRVFTQEL